MRVFTLFIILFWGCAFRSYGQEGPTNPMPGKCYALCLIPDQYETTTEEVVMKPETVHNTIIPATFEIKTKYIQVKPAGKRFIYTPPVYEKVSEKVAVKGIEKVMIKPESKRFVQIPAIYEDSVITYLEEEATTRIEVIPPSYKTTTQQVEKKPAYTKWVRKNAGPDCLSGNPDDCFVWCMVEVPAEFETITKQINEGCMGTGVPDAGCKKIIEVQAKYKTITVQREKSPASYREETVPPEFTVLTKQSPAAVVNVNVTKQVMKSPGFVREEIIPAEYKAVMVKIVQTPATTRTETVPAQYNTVNKRKLLKAGGFTAWREVLCEEKTSKYTIRQIQKALNDKGYDAGPADNVMGARTKAALTKFQKDKGLPLGNLDIETLKALGINYPNSN